MLAVIQVGKPAALLSTAYGNVLLAKIALLLVLFALVAVNRWRLTGPAAKGEAKAVRRLCRAIAVESLIVLAVFAVAATWRFTPPPRALAVAAAEPASIHIHSDKAMAEVTGPVVLNIWVSSTAKDVDIFATIRNIGPDGKDVFEVGQQGEPLQCVTKGWLRASHRKLDPEKTLPYRPYHPHTGKEPLKPGEVYELDIEIWPTCIVLPEGYRIALTVRGKDYVFPGGSGGKLSPVWVKRPAES